MLILPRSSQGVKMHVRAGLLTYFRVLNAFPKPVFELLSEASASLVGKQERVLVAKGDLFST